MIDRGCGTQRAAWHGDHVCTQCTDSAAALPPLTHHHHRGRAVSRPSLSGRPGQARPRRQRQRPWAWPRRPSPAACPPPRASFGAGLRARSLARACEEGGQGGGSEGGWGERGRAVGGERERERCTRTEIPLLLTTPSTEPTSYYSLLTAYYLPYNPLELEAELQLGDLVARDAGGVGGADARGRAPRDARDSRARHLEIWWGFVRARALRARVSLASPLAALWCGFGRTRGLEFEPDGHRELARRSPRRCCERS